MCTHRSRWAYVGLSDTNHELYVSTLMSAFAISNVVTMRMQSSSFGVCHIIGIDSAKKSS